MPQANPSSASHDRDEQGRRDTGSPDVAALLRRVEELEIENARLRAGETPLLRTILESATEYAIVTTDLDGRVTSWNAGARDILGWTEDEIMGRDVRAVFTPEDRAAGAPEEEMRRALADGRSREERWHLRKDGSRFWASNIMMPLRDGGVVGFLKILRDRTEDRRKDAALRAANERAVELLESMPEAFLALDRDYRITYHNAAGERIDGRPRGAILGLTHGEAWPASVGTPIEAAYRRAMDERVSVELEHLDRRDGGELWLEIRVHPTPDGIAVFYRDISRRKGAEAALRANKERLKIERELLDAIIRQAPVGISITEAPSGHLLVLNDKAAELIGHGARGEENQRYEMYGAVHADGRPYAVEDYPTTRALRNGETIEQETMIHHRGDGQVTRLAVSSAPVRDSDGGVVAAVTVFIDIEERLRQEEATRVLADSIPQLAWMARPDGWIFWYNKRWHDYTGTTLEEMQGWGWQAVHHPDHADRVVAGYREAIRSGGPWEDTFPLRGGDGSFRWFLSRALPVRDGDGRVTMWFGTNTDVTDRREAEAALQAAKEEAERANFSKTKFLAIASHDLRQPLQSLLLFLEALKPHVVDDKGQAKLVHLGRGLDAMKELLDSLMDISRLDAGTIQPAIEDFPIRDLVGEITSAYSEVAKAKGLVLRSAPCDMMVRSDRTLLGRMLRNLVENAVRYAGHGDIMLICRRNGPSLRIDVADTGVGIPTEHLGRIWDEFHQVGNAERDRNQGLGLGLAIVQRLSQLLDHPVDVSSTPGKGSTFSITVPLGRAVPVQATPCAPARRGNGRFAVVVDDDAIVLLGLQTILQEWGYAVLIAGSTDEALARLRADGRRPDIIIADYRLRGGRFGTEAVAAIRALIGAPLRGILLTGETGPEFARDAAAHGLAVIHKPVTPRQLSALIEEQLAAE